MSSIPVILVDLNASRAFVIDTNKQLVYQRVYAYLLHACQDFPLAPFCVHFYHYKIVHGWR
jgi:hypothetical protein